MEEAALSNPNTLKLSSTQASFCWSKSISHPNYWLPQLNLLFVYTRVCLCVYRYNYVYGHVEASGQHHLCCPQYHLIFFEAGFLSGQGIDDWTKMNDHWVQRSACQCFPSVGITIIYHCNWIYFFLFLNVSPGESNSNLHAWTASTLSSELHPQSNVYNF